MGDRASNLSSVGQGKGEARHSNTGDILQKTDALIRLARRRGHGPIAIIWSLVQVLKRHYSQSTVAVSHNQGKAKHTQRYLK
jgi:hypothetical protein